MPTSEGAEAIEAFIAKQAVPLQPVVRRLRAIVREVAPDLFEYLDSYGSIRFSAGGRGMNEWICFVSGHTAHADLGFSRGTSLPDPEGLLEGTGKNLRHVKVRSMEAAEQPGLRRLVEAAVALHRASAEPSTGV